MAIACTFQTRVLLLVALLSSLLLLLLLYLSPLSKNSNTSPPLLSSFYTTYTEATTANDVSLRSSVVPIPLPLVNSTVVVDGPVTEKSDESVQFPPSPSPLASPNSNIGSSPMTVVTTSKKRDRNVERIEDGLARAREAIHEAIRSQNSSSYKKNTYVPRGSVYRNPYAFHQSHTEMEKRFKVWVYREGEQPLIHGGPVNNIYGIEGQLIDEFESGKSNFLARHPDEAHTFFLPISVVFIMRFVYSRPRIIFSRFALQRLVKDYIDVVAGKYPYWNRSMGADHFLVSCHDWAPDISKANPKFYKNFIRVLCNANTSERFEPHRDVSMPEINIPVGKLGPSAKAQPPSKRSILAFFAGGAHGYIRKLLLAHWKDKDDEIQVHEYLPKKEDYLRSMSQSKFCLCPSGYEVASPRVVTAIQLGCVPVTISDNYSLPFSDVLDWSKFSIHIPSANISQIKAILKGLSNRQYRRMQRRVMTVQRHFFLNRPAQPYDMIHMVLHSVWLRRMNVMLP